MNHPLPRRLILTSVWPLPDSRLVSILDHVASRPGARGLTRAGSPPPPAPSLPQRRQIGV
ncbi:hypothetical protein ACFVU3_13485 [Streptomyces sp. NPDC058052]|uniref:hypothetical protein n=1 Tax=Streptomyces sp. NPDC058052 TaxID=3346316 RepID=UPI0036EF9A7A